jgi:autotransporter-associated beta strand protein
MFQVGGVTGDVGYIAEVDLSALGALSVDLGNGTFRVGSTAGGSGNATNTMRLATNSTIVAGRIGVGDFTSKFAGPNTLMLGAGETRLYADNLFIAGGKSDSLMLFDGATGSLTVSNRAGTGRANLSVGVNLVGTAGNVAGILDTRGHEVSLYLGAVTNGGRAAGSTGWGSGEILFDQGTLDAQSMIVGFRNGSGTGVVTGRLDIGGGTVNLGSLELARNTSSSGNPVIGDVDLRGGVITMGGNITKGGGAGAAASLLMTNSAVLDMGGFSIGSGANPIDTLQLDSGTLRNVSEINGGAAWTKNGPGTLTVEGVNSYAGNLTAAMGTLKYNGTYTGGGLITVQGGATLMGTGTLAAVTVEAGGILKPGNSAGILTVDALTLDGGTLLEYELLTTGGSDLILAGATILGGIGFDNFTFLPGVGFGPGVYTLIDATSISGLGTGTTGTVGGYDAALSIDGDNQDLLLTVIPEPGTLGLIGMLTVVAALFRRRLRS